WHVVCVRVRTSSREQWLREQERELANQIQRGRPGPPTLDGQSWLGRDHALLDQGWVAWRVHAFHDDPHEGQDWSGLGDIAIMTDDTGKLCFSRAHFCDGTIPWALGVPPATPPPRPTNVDAFLKLFRPGTWTGDRSYVESAMAPRSGAG